MSSEMVSVSEKEFEGLAADALDSLPDWVHQRMDNVEVVIENAPPPGQPGLLGLYHGIPLTKRGAGLSGVLPDTITLYQSTIERVSRNEQELRDRVRHVVVHEVAHYFGISDDRLREMDRY
jgi:predicted Zn-dependent protease with MMP-like domain